MVEDSGNGKCKIKFKFLWESRGDSDSDTEDEDEAIVNRDDIRREEKNEVDDIKKCYFESAINDDSFARVLADGVRNNPELAEWKNNKGQRAIDLACLECRSAMQKALFFLGRYDVDKCPPAHRSATSLVVRAVDAGTLRGGQDMDGYFGEIWPWRHEVQPEDH